MRYERLGMTLDTDSVPLLTRELAINGWMLQTIDGNDEISAVLFVRPMFTRPLVTALTDVGDDDVTTRLLDVPTIRELQDQDTEPYEKEIA